MTRAQRDAAASRTPRILILGFPESVHSARWAAMLRGRGLQLVFLPVNFGVLAPEFGQTSSVANAEDLARLTDTDIGIFDLASVAVDEIAAVQDKINYQPWTPAWFSGVKMAHPAHVAAAVRRLAPDLIHSMIVQFGGYLVAASKQLLGADFPAWLLSNWGSDIFLYRMQPEHRERIMSIIPMLDGYHSECQRDVSIARQLGFRKLVCPAIPASGGINFSVCPTLDDLLLPSRRHQILVKGYHGWAGRGLHILSAVHLAADALRGFQIRITLAGPAVREMAAEVAERDRLDIACDPYLPNHSDALERLSQARVVIGLGISDGISTTLLEAMVMGTFPIQGDRSCGGEWITAGETGFLVSPHDPAQVAESLVRAVSDDDLVDKAARRNRAVIEQRWNAHVNGPLAADFYRALIEQRQEVIAQGAESTLSYA